MAICKNCGNKAILASAFISRFIPDEEPFESGVYEECGFDEINPGVVSVGVHWCSKCDEIVNVWIEDPMDRDLATIKAKQLQDKVNQLESIIVQAKEAVKTTQDKITQLQADKETLEAELEEQVAIDKDLKETIFKELAKSRGLQAELDRHQGYPIQDGENIPEWLAKLVHRGYVNCYGNQQSYDRIRERGGFGKSEVVWYLNHCLNIKTLGEADQALREQEKGD